MNKRIKFLEKTVAGFVLATSMIWQPAVAAEPWPSKPVQIIVPIDAGSIQDSIARRLAIALSTTWNQSVTVVNQAGASGTIGTNTVATATADGTTLGLVGATFTGALAARDNLPYTRDKVTGVIKFGRQDFMIFANKNVPYDNVQQMAEYARANPGKIDYATPGPGTLVNITMEHFAKSQDLKFTHVPYRNLMQAAPDVASGRIHLVLNTANTALQGLVAKGDIKIIGGLGRNPRYNGQPVSSLANLSPDVNGGGFFGLITTGGTPKPVVEKIHKDVAAIVDTDEFRQFLISVGGTPEASSRSGEFDRWIDTEVDRLKKIIVRTNIKLE